MPLTDVFAVYENFVVNCELHDGVGSEFVIRSAAATFDHTPVVVWSKGPENDCTQNPAERGKFLTLGPMLAIGIGLDYKM